jgi:hypothetical protein
MYFEIFSLGGIGIMNTKDYTMAEAIPISVRREF